MCVHVYTHASFCVHVLHHMWSVCMWVCSCTGQSEVSGVFLFGPSHPLIALRILVSHWVWSSWIWQDPLANELRGSSCPCFPLPVKAHSHIPHPDFDVALGIQIRIFMLLRQTFYQLSWLPSPSFVFRITIIWFKWTNECFFCSWLYPKHSFSYVLFHSALYAVDHSSFWDICIYLLWFSSSSPFLSLPILFNPLEQSSLIRVSLGPGSFFFWTPRY